MIKIRSLLYYTITNPYWSVTVKFELSRTIQEAYHVVHNSVLLSGLVHVPIS